MITLNRPTNSLERKVLHIFPIDLTNVMHNLITKCVYPLSSSLDANLETIFISISRSYSAPVRAILKYVQTNAHVEEELL